MPKSEQFSERAQSEIETEEAVKSVGDCEPRRSGRTPWGEVACFACGNYCRVRNECPIYLAKFKIFGGEKQCYEGKKGAEARFSWLPSGNSKMRKVPQMPKSSAIAKIMLISRLGGF